MRLRHKLKVWRYYIVCHALYGGPPLNSSRAVLLTPCSRFPSRCTICSTPPHPPLCLATNHRQLAPCQTHLFWMEDPWVRPACKWGGDCTFPHPKAEGPKDPELLRTNIALQTENSQLARVRAYASDVLGKGGEASDTGIARSGTSRWACVVQNATATHCFNRVNNAPNA